MAKPSRPDLVVILGAGASQSCHLPSTAGLTNAVVMPAGTIVESTTRYRTTPVDLPQHWDSDQDAWSMTQLFWEALRGIYKSPNFETYVHALETLEPIAYSRRSVNTIGDLDDFRPIATAFMEVLGRFDPLFRAEIIRIERINVTRRIFEALNVTSHSTAHARFPEIISARAAFNQLFSALARQFRLWVLTLNYDDLIDDALPKFRDGFTKPTNSDAFAFDPGAFTKLTAKSEGRMLLHLHGNVRYGYLTTDPRRAPLIAKYPDRMKALQAINKAISSREALRGDTVQGGVVRANAPMISGFQKADKLMLAPAPFGYYFHEAVTRLLQTNRVLVLGYGCRDPHINTWLFEAARIHGSKYRLGFVTCHVKPRIPTVSIETEWIKAFLYGITEMPISWEDTGDVYYLDPKVMSVKSGMPMHPELVSEVISFLKSGKKTRTIR